MLKSLYVRDFALIDELSVSFAPGLTIITGETGAGKSILMGALNMVLGERASAEVVRAGARKAVIEAVFGGEHYENIGEMLDEEQIERTPELILRRDISATGQSRCFINDTPCTVSLLKRAGKQLVDLHGQHDHQLLLHTETHAGMLDGFGLLHAETAQYRNTLEEYRKLRHELQSLNERADMLRKKRDFIDYQYRELDAAALVEGEERSIDEEINLLENAETLFNLGTALGEHLYASESSAYTTLSSAVHLLEKLSAIDKSFEPWLEELRGATATVEELNRFVGSYIDGIDFNGDRLEALRERQILLQRLAKKHGKSIDELIALRDRLAEELSLEENLAGELTTIEAEIQKARKALSASAETLSAHRREAAERLEQEIMTGLATLGIPHSTFEVRFTREALPDGDIEIDGTRYRAFDNGCDRIEFMISTNLGESPKPLAKVASGGEISRVMLAMKSALARSAELPILVFDEIDTGISGKVAQSVGFSLKRLSRMHQIIAITHLPQIAAMSDLHLAVVKRIQADRTLTGVTPLDKDEHVREVARLFSGTEITETSLQLAEELIEAGRSA
ncbi:MAG TPA: DNA repair protein RecN [Chlorobaculum sp.]|uniref:DNA repair protein RecN n=1 Tax=Chlorobaculum tepidum (strain ATCC 49652 / DSM 12025 / NBRC 103806 / TLS) TaxID=194439 RepID=Q8KC12_CHLTE|nr:DNA repair protein RecN [Chlorobaculum tepidum]AAM72843.1 recombination/replication protein RecN [Chlorobaculum tepidum TLS]HBU22471.1 DNA repair protein RecN [Chlorobaculum sp.]